MRPDGSPNFCSKCGSALSHGDSFCSKCGSEVGSGFDGDRYPQNPELRRRVEDLTVEGWEVKHDYGDRVVMIRREFGSIPLHILLLLSTSGIGNLFYAWYCYSPDADRIELRADGSEELLENDGFSTRWSVKRVFGIAVSLLFSVFAAIAGILILWTTTGAIQTGFGVAFLVFAALSFALSPQFIPGFESPTTFGRVRSTEEKTVFEPTTPCTVCAEPVGNGVKRSYDERKYVAGIPIQTINDGENHYCRGCARGDVPGGLETEFGDTVETESV